MTSKGEKSIVIFCLEVSVYSIHVQFLICYKKWIFKEEGLYEILITMNSQRCWIVNIRAKILIVKRFFMKSAKYCNSWLAIHGFWCTAYWMCSMYRYQCCHYSVFFNMVFFLYSTFLFGCYNITKLLCDQI